MDGFTIPAGNELGASLIDFADPAPSPNIALPPSHHKTEAQSRQQRQQPAPTCPGVPVKVRQRREAIMSLCKHYAQGIDAKDLEILKALLLEEANSVLGVFLPFEILESKGRIAVAPVGRPWDPDDPETKMNDPGTAEPIAKAAEDIESSPHESSQDEEENEHDYLDPS
ncbi:hypothetical protein H2203_006362 [Taxawa tesnikishii (nom. ined.)]|nr:hypothetical protein H2203_006362 [Dothideales sp. JES 119]